jgi:hypothetical protein
MNQGTKWVLLMKKTGSKKSCASVPLKMYRYRYKSFPCVKKNIQMILSLKNKEGTIKSNIVFKSLPDFNPNLESDSNPDLESDPKLTSKPGSGSGSGKKINDPQHYAIVGAVGMVTNESACCC